MSSLRSHDDTWDIATSVGSTAVMVAPFDGAQGLAPAGGGKDRSGARRPGGVGTALCDASGAIRVRGRGRA